MRPFNGVITFIIYFVSEDLKCLLSSFFWGGDRAPDFPFHQTSHFIYSSSPMPFLFLFTCVSHCWAISPKLNSCTTNVAHFLPSSSPESASEGKVVGNITNQPSERVNRFCLSVSKTVAVHWIAVCKHQNQIKILTVCRKWNIDLFLYTHTHKHNYSSCYVSSIFVSMVSVVARVCRQVWSGCVTLAQHLLTKLQATFDIQW